MLVQKKMKKGDSMTKIADDLLEDEITILPIYNLAKKYPEDTEKDIYQRLNQQIIIQYILYINKEADIRETMQISASFCKI